MASSSFESSPMSSNYTGIHKTTHDSNNGMFHPTQVVAVVVPFPAQGHLNQLLHLSRLILTHNIPVHFVGSATHNRQAMVRAQGWDPNSISNIHIHDGVRSAEHILPRGFEERVKGIGLIVRDWAPQLEILSHPSTGGFMSHCGWNSCMESITMGVPIAAWPMHSDQPRNRVLVTEVLKVGVVVKEWDHRDELVTASDVENAVKRLMGTKEGDEMRERAMNLKNAIEKSRDEGGVSRLELDDFIAHVTR